MGKFTGIRFNTNAVRALRMDFAQSTKGFVYINEKSLVKAESAEKNIVTSHLPLIDP